MSKRVRQYIGILAAAAAYYLIHEGAHLLCALAMGTFRQVRVMGPGIQIDVWAERMTDTRMGLFCLCAPIATLTSGWLLSALSGTLCRAGSRVLRSAAYYVTMVMLLLDPLYLGFLYPLVGGGDMNGIALLLPRGLARTGFEALLAVNGLLFLRLVLPRYRAGRWD